jgi:CRP-like cAMP-binding protein
VPLNVLTPGDAFGELALVQQRPRSASVRASTPLEAFRLDRSVFLALMRIYPALSEAFGVGAEALRHGDFLRLHPAFAGLPPARLVELVAGTGEVALADGEIAVAAGRPRAGVFLVTSGRLAAVDADGRQLYRLHAGDVFGELGLEDDPRRPAFLAAGEARLLHLDGEPLRRLVADYPDVGARLDERAALVASRRRDGSALSSADGPVVAASEKELARPDRRGGHLPVPDR